MFLSIGQLIPLKLQLSDGATDQFPRALLYNAADSLVATVDLAHVASGLYKSDAQTMPNTAYISAIYLVYSDSGHTTLASYDRIIDSWQLQTLATAASLATLQTDVTTIGTYVDTEVAAIKAKTDGLPSDPADASDIAAAFSTVNTTLSTIAGYIDTEVAAIKAKTDNLPSDPADASDIAAAFAITNGKIDVVDDFLDTEIAAIKAKTDNLPSDPADASDIASSFSTVNTTLSTIAGYVDTEVSAIKAKTDNLPSDPADHSLVMAAIAAVQATTDDIAGLLHRNARLDSQVYDESGNMLTARLRVFANLLAATASDPTHANGVDGEIARYSITATYDVDGKCTSYLLVQELP